MGTGYTRNDTDNNIADGNVINAADFDGEFDAIVSAFSTSGHTHDGTSAEGGPVTVLGPAQDFVVSATTVTPKTTNTLDLGTDALEFKDIYIDGVAYIDGLGRDLLVSGTNKIQFRDTAISISSTDDGELDLVADGDIFLTAGVDINIPANVGLTFGDDAEKIEGDGTDLTITGNNIKLTATADVVLPANVGLVLDGSGNEKIESDGTDISISVGSGGDINIPANIGVTFGDDGEKIEGDGTDLTINSSNDLNLTATTDINIPANVGLTFGDDAEKIEGDGTVLTISGNNINLTAVADVNIPSGVGLTFATAEKIESDGTDLSITVGSGGDINIPADIGLTFGNDGEKIEGDGTNLAINSSAELDIVAPTIDIDASTSVTIDTSAITVTADTATFTSANANDPLVVIKNTTNDTNGARLQFVKDKGAAGADGDVAGIIEFVADDAGQELTTVAKITAVFQEADTSQEGGKLSFGIATHDAEFQDGLILSDGNAEDEIDVTIGNGANSLTTIAGTLTSTGAITSNAGVVVDNITIDGTEIDLSSGDLTIDVAGDITVDAGGGDFLFNDDGTAIFQFSNSSLDFHIISMQNNKDMVFRGNDGGSFINALTLDMSEAGAATFNSTVTANAGVVVDNITIDGTTIALSSGTLVLDSAVNIDLDADNGSVTLKDGGVHIASINMTSSDLQFYTEVADKNIKFSGNDGGSPITALTLDIGNSGAATFNSTVTANAGVIVDNITIDGAEIDVSSGNFRLDVAGTLFFDSDSGIIDYEDGGTTFLRIQNSSSDAVIQSIQQDKDIIFKGDDGGGTITALTLDMSDAGTATFNHDVKLPDSGELALGAGSDLKLYHNGSHSFIKNTTGDLNIENDSDIYIDSTHDIILDADGNEVLFKHAGDLRYEFKLDSTPDLNVTGGNFTIQTQTDDADILFKGSDGGSGITALTLDMSQAGEADFNGALKVSGGIVAHQTDRGVLEYSSNKFQLRSYGNSAGSGQIEFKTGGGGGSTDTLAMMIDNNQKLLIGNSTSQTTDLLQVESPASGGGHGIAIRRNDNNTDQQLGRIMFGNTVDSDIGQIDVKTDGATNSGAMRFSTASSGTTSERMRIDSSGRVIIGTATDSNAHSNADNLIVGNVPASGVNAGITLVSGDNANGAIHFSDGTSSGNANIQGQFIYDHSQSDFLFYTAAAERLKVNATGITITDGDLIIGTAGHGIDFSAQTATSASGAATSSGGEILDHYEEGTFTPDVGSASGSGSSATGKTGNFTRIGNRVYADFFLSVSGLGSTSGAFFIVGFPFPANANNILGQGAVRSQGIGGSNDIPVTFEMVAGGSYGRFHFMSGTNAQRTVQCSDISANDFIAASICYIL